MRQKSCWALAAILTLFYVLSTGCGASAQADLVDQQIASLKSPDAAVRENAAGALGILKDPRAVEPLIGALQDPEVKVRYTAATSLGMIKDQRAVAPLIPLLKERDFEMQLSVSMALGRLRDPRAIEPLIAVMTDPSLGDGRFAIMALQQIGPASTEPLLVLLKNGDANTRKTAAYALEGIGGKQAVDPLIAALKDPDPEVRAAVPVPLAMNGLIDHPPAQPEKYKDRCAEITAFRARQTEDPKVTDALLAAAKDPDPHVRATIAIAFQITKDPRVVDALLADLKDPVPDVRSVAARSLGDFNDPQVIDPLLDALSDSYQGTRIYAAESLAKWKESGGDAVFLAALQSVNADKRLAAANVLAHRHNAQGIQVLIEALKDPQPKTRMEAVGFLRGVNDDRILDALLALMHDSDMGVRQLVVAAIGERKDTRAVAPLVAAFESASNTQKGMYLGALGNMGEQGVDPLLAALKNPDYEWRKAAIRALGTTKSPRAIPVLVEQLKDPYDGMVHSEAAEALAEIGDPRGIGPVIELLRGPSFDGFREGIPSILIKFGPQAVEPLIAVLQDENRHARFLAAQALGEIKDPRAEKALMNALHEGNLPAVAGASTFFVFRGDPGSEDALVDALNQFGTELMANLYLSCGNPKLEAAARAWTRKRGWQMRQQSYGMLWGHEPKTPGPCESELDH
jgi:HEAT repeat protein